MRPDFRMNMTREYNMNCNYIASPIFIKGDAGKVDRFLAAGDSPLSVRRCGGHLAQTAHHTRLALIYHYNFSGWTRVDAASPAYQRERRRARNLRFKRARGLTCFLRRTVRRS